MYDLLMGTVAFNTTRVTLNPLRIVSANFLGVTESACYMAARNRDAHFMSQIAEKEKESDCSDNG